jgi:GNAT superfamily N-acetyltransferase
MSRSWVVRPVGAQEFEQWTRLFRGYCDFYFYETTEEHQRQIWSWIHDEEIMDAIVVVETNTDGDEVGVLRGIAHLREWIRPLRGARCGYLDDLFVDPDVRGDGAVQSLFDAMKVIARDRQWSIIRWTTADNNYRARSTYDKLAQRTTWITYDMDTSHT